MLSKTNQIEVLLLNTNMRKYRKKITTLFLSSSVLMTSVWIHAEGGGAGSNFGSNTPWATCDPSVGFCHTAIEEVIVTSSWRSESLQGMSVAVRVLTGPEIEKVNQRDIVVSTQVVPGVTGAKNEDYETDLSIRGMGNEANQNSGAAPSVARHMDGEFIDSPYLQTDFVDIERIEVLKGYVPITPM